MIKGLYIHIPFCDQICTYCDFAKMVASEEMKVDYLRALVKEIEYFSDLVANIETIYIGGGTPSSLDNNLIEAFLEELKNLVPLDKVKEFTIEVNPNDVCEELLDIFSKYNVSRISMGVQTLNNDLLRFLGRTHTDDTIYKAVEMLKNRKLVYNLDFLYAIPCQLKKNVEFDLDFIEKYQPAHVSYYSLIVEDKTILNYLINKHRITDFSEDLAREFGEYIDDRLETMGYQKYEFSNYCKEGKKSKHNLLYWNLDEYLGVGLNASSQYNNTRLKNPKKIREYIEGTKKHALVMHEIEEFNPKMEMILMGLRKTEGVDLKKYKLKFNQDLLVVYPILTKHIDNGLLEITNSHIRFTKQGAYLSNQVYLDLV